MYSDFALTQTLHEVRSDFALTRVSSDNFSNVLFDGDHHCGIPHTLLSFEKKQISRFRIEFLTSIGDL